MVSLASSLTNFTPFNETFPAPPVSRNKWTPAARLGPAGTRPRSKRLRHQEFESPFLFRQQLVFRVACVEYSRSYVSPNRGLNYGGGVQVSTGMVLRVGTW